VPGRADRALVVGACQAGVQLACSLRDMGYAHAITLVGEERHPPYQRPPLSKALLLNEQSNEALVLRDRAYLAERGIELVLGKRIVELVRDERGGQARAQSGDVYPYTELAIAVGAAPRRLTVPGCDAQGVHYLRDLSDAGALGAALRNAVNVVVLGGGFIGLEVAASARLLGRSVSVVLADDRLMSRAVSPMTSGVFDRAHRGHGISFHYDETIQAVETDRAGRVAAVTLASGPSLPADVVLVGIGALPRTDLAERYGLEIGNGVVLDQFCTASDGVTVAAGDCANVPNPMRGIAPQRVRFESVSTAIEQAKVAAATLCGTPRRYASTPWFWSDQYDLKLQAAGFVSAGSEVIVRGAGPSTRYTALHFDGDTLTGVECVNSPGDFMILKTAMNNGSSVDKTLARDGDVPLRDALGKASLANAEAP